MEDSTQDRRSKRDTSYKAKVVEEKEHVKEVLSRYKDERIVDDDSTGYVEDGKNIFDDDMDLQSIAQASNKGKGTKRKIKNLSENAEEGKLQQMLSSMPKKIKTEAKIDDDVEVLSEIHGEIDSPSTSIAKSKIKKALSKKLAAKEYKRNFLKSVKKLEKLRKSLQLTDTHEQNSTPLKEVTGTVEQPTKRILEPEMTREESDNDFVVTLIEEVESKVSVTGEKLADNIQADFKTKWENTSVNINSNDQTLLDKTDIPLEEVDGEKIFRFFWWDAYEDPVYQKGSVFLFGRTYCKKTKSFMSCCVAVRNIERKIFVLPRPFVLGNDGQPTDNAVTRKNVHDEFIATILKPLGVKSFRTKPTMKKYAFNPNIPSESEYMEVRYAASDPRIDVEHLPKKIRTFSKIFGANTNFLETLFLDRKIKGPCWLDISNPVPVSNPVSWCKFEVNCMKSVDLKLTPSEKPLPPPPLVVAAINMRSCINRSTGTLELVMLSCLAHNEYEVDKQPPDPPFQQHFCVFTRPSDQQLPSDLHDAICKYKTTKVQKMDSEKGMFNFFVQKFTAIDPDLIVGHDLQGYQINVLVNRLLTLNNMSFNKLGRLKVTDMKALEKSLFVGRLVCDIKVSAKELIKSRSYDLETLCQVVLKLNRNERIELEPQDIPKMYKTSADILKLISFTMQDAMYIIKMMYGLNVIPLALHITNIAGNVMSRTLMGGRAERIEFLLLHAFSEKGFILPDKEYKKNIPSQNGSNKTPTYVGGLVLDPKVGFYNKLILLMDFNSLYPSIIQEYNICFTTLPVTEEDDDLYLPDSSLPPGILPTEIRKLVESRRQVKDLMKRPDLSNDLRVQYDIKQMALKLTATSMCGCLGFANSRFYAKNLAALVTQKGREILTNTKDMIEKMNYNVVYGDTDSIMINTNISEYEQVFEIGLKIKQEVNKLYKQVELDIDGVLKYLLLLKKRKYAAISLAKDKNGGLVATKEYKGLEIVRRDWSQLSCEAGKNVLDQILSDQSPDDRIENIHKYLKKIRNDLEEGKVPLPLLVINKQLTKDPHTYPTKAHLPHVQVALRYNKNSGGHFRSGDTVPYIICEDGTDNNAIQRAYHVDEIKNSAILKIDYDYYLRQQIHPVVTRICEPIEGTDSYQIAECLGLDLQNFKKPPNQSVELIGGENMCRPEIKFRNVDAFKFVCYVCKQENIVKGPLVGATPFLKKCQNADCKTRPIDYLPCIQNQVALSIRSYIKKYYQNVLICEDPACTNKTRKLPLRFIKGHPICNVCKKGVLSKVYNEQQLYKQLDYFQHIFDLEQLLRKPVMDREIESGYRALQDTVEKYINHSLFSKIDMTSMFMGLDVYKMNQNQEADSKILENQNDLNEDDVVEEL